uniref:F-actin monooxygenase n=1 Tax=Geotrypetes seraphini TaxID=260995 RepID=A0A6P8P4W8_GEOSA|nr:F-actin-monooxygenase MICAL2 isoform X7 [Geotrypetes seraphini]
MGENDEKPHRPGQLFENFVQATTCKGTLQAFNILTRQLDLDPLEYKHFYSRLKSKVSSWKAKALWNKLDKRGGHKEYKRGKSCTNTKCLIIGGGPCGLRTAIELAYLGAKVVVVEKRDTFSRNNVLHLWPFTIHDLRGLGAKKFYGKFCAGSIDHISIRQLQLVLFKVALLLGVEIHVNLEFVKVLEPPEDQENQKVGWRAEFLPVDHPLSEYEFDVIVGADGRRNTLEGFRRKEFRGKLAIAITANFVNRNTTAEAKVEEISGVAFIFNQKFFQDLKEETGIDLENIVYYKDSTHYFVMTAKKQSLLDKGVIIDDYTDTEMLLCGENVSQENLQSYAREAADFATNYQLPSLDFAINHYGQPDVAMFDFTSMYASENAALVRERHGHQLLVCLVGDSLLEPFWPMGTGCARGFLAAFDSAWMVKSWAQKTPPLETLAERESLYRLLPQTTPENINKNFDQYTIDPGTRYPNLNSSCVRPHQVRHLYLTNELLNCPLERVSSIRRSVRLSRHDSDVRPNKLLTWCQKQTEGYRNVNITDLTSSWKSGLALCAVIHSFRPDIIDFDSLNEDDPVQNNQLAFDTAEREFGISPITTGKEMASASEPDKLSLVMYLSKFYELFRGTPLRAVDPVSRENGKNGEAYSVKSTSFNNYINLTVPRKRLTKVERRFEENDVNKRRRKGTHHFEELSSFSGQSASSGSEYGDAKEGQHQNKVKSMATQLLAKFEENAPNTSLRRQGSLRKEFPANLGGSDICYFCNKRVYVMERQSAEGHFFHRECFRCHFCSTTIRLGVYAYDVDEGKFYCKPHFKHCKTHKQRKRRAELKAQVQDDDDDNDGTWKNENPKALAIAESNYPGSSPEDSPPDCFWQLDEITSPKKSKNVLEHYDLESGFSSADASSEWTSVKVVPEEAITEHNLLAVRVMVASDGSSSDIESDGCDHLCNSGSSKELAFSPEPVPPELLLKRHASMNGNIQWEKRDMMSRAAGALHRANRFHSATPNTFQKWREKTPSAGSLSIGKNIELSSEESIPYILDTPEEDYSQGQMLSHNNPSEITRWRKELYDPALHDTISEEIPPYKPHHSHLLNRTEDCLLEDDDSDPSRTAKSDAEDSLVQKFRENSTRTREHTLEKFCVNNEEQPTRTDAFNNENMDSFSKVTATRDGRDQEDHKKMTDQESNQKSKKLVLSEEEKSILLDWNSDNSGAAKSENETTDALVRSVPETGKCSRRSSKLKPQSLLLSAGNVNDSPLSLSRDQHDESRIPTTDNATTAGTESSPISPFKLLANAIKRSLLEPLSSTPENVKWTSDSKSKLVSPNSIFDLPSPITRPGILRRSRSNKECSTRSGGSLYPENVNSFSSQRETVPHGSGTPNTKYSTLAGESDKPPAHENLPSAKVEDFMPTLLEKFSLLDNSSTEVADISHSQRRKSSLFSRLRFKDRTAGTDRETSEKNNIWSEKETKEPLHHSSPFTPSSTSSMLSSSGEQEPGSKDTLDRKQENKNSSASSADEFEHKPSPPLKSKRPFKRRKKLEREAKQQAKREELNRLHKIQGIQQVLHEIEERQRSLETQGVKMEKALRGESADSHAQDESQLLQEWFELVLEKNKLARYESELSVIIEELELEDHQCKLEKKLREKILARDRLKDEKSISEEQEILTEVMKVIKQRDKLVSFLEQQRLEERAEDKSFENFALSRGYRLSTDMNGDMRML